MIKDLATLAGDSTRFGSSSSGSHGGLSSSCILAAISLLVLLVIGSIRNHGSVLLVFVDGPVEHVIVLVGLADEQVAEDLAEVGVVRLVIKTQGASVVEVDGELVGESTAEDLGGRGHLLFHDAVIFLLLGGRLQPLPRESATAEVEHDISERFHIITTRLLNTKVSVDTSITSRSGEVLVLTVRDVEVRLGIAVLLGKAEINHIDLVSTLADTH